MITFLLSFYLHQIYYNELFEEKNAQAIIKVTLQHLTLHLPPLFNRKD